jgi:hypothetical protein
MVAIRIPAGIGVSRYVPFMRKPVVWLTNFGPGDQAGPILVPEAQ